MTKHFVGCGPQERDFNQEELPRVRRELVFRHFGSDAGHPLLRTEWKDGIDLEVPTYALQCFAEAYAREVLASVATPAAAPTTEPAEFKRIGYIHKGDRFIYERRGSPSDQPVYSRATEPAFAATPPAAGLVAEPADPTDPGYDVAVLREHVRHLERRVRQLSVAEPPERP
jgi:hypothetical protein